MDGYRAFVEQAYPDPSIRSTVLLQLAESILTADAISSGCWSVSFRGNQIRLNVGRLETLVLRENQLDIVVDRDAANEAPWTEIRQELDLAFKWNGEPFKVLRSAYGVLLPADRIEEVLPILRPLHVALVQRAVQTVQTRTPFYQAHDPGVMAYLREVVAEDLPDPDYGPVTNAERSRPRYWKVSAGTGGNRWDLFQEQACIAINWTGSPDLRTLDAASTQKLRQGLNALAPEFSFSHTAARQLWTFLQEMVPGDGVCAYGSKTLLGWGEITGDYDFADEVPDFPHRREVRWASTEPRPTTSLPASLAEKLTQNITILELTAEEFGAIAGEAFGATTRTWWVNQGATYEQERAGGYLWAPKVGKGGYAFAHWTNMAKLQLGDLVLHYANGALRAVGLVQASTIDARRPAELPTESWEDDGFLARVVYHHLASPIALREIPAGWRYAGDGPFTQDGGIKQGYLFPIAEDFVAKLFASLADRLPEAVRGWRLSDDGSVSEAVAAIRAAVEGMYPDPVVRETCLTVFANGIERAHAISPASWAVSMPQGRDHIRFNVAWTQPCILSTGDLSVVFDRNALDETTQDQVEMAFANDPRNRPAYASVADAAPYRAHLPVDRLDALLPLVHDAYLHFIATCAERVKTRAHRYQEHVPAVIDYLRQELGRDLPQPDHGAPPTEVQQAWLFQASPAVWNLGEELQRRSVGDDATWSVSRFRDEMSPGQPVVLWQGGKDAGVYAVGELIDAPFVRRTADFWPDRDERGPTEWAVPFVYTRILANPVLKSDLLADPILRDLSVVRGPQGTNFKLAPEQWQALQDLLDEEPELPPEPTLDDLASLTHLDLAELEELEALLLDKRQVVLEGPPGSGKTFLAEHFARYFAGLPLHGGSDERVETVQFHQSYGYEDFVQGIRPVTDEHGRLQYHVLPGIFMRMCDLAARNPEQRFVLIIDEINRGNLSRIFGELLLLLEYRDKRVRLPYGAVEGATEQTYLTIPSNLYLIGTMNSTDRSLALIDYALRRRFYFYRLLPVVEGRAPVLERWLAGKGLPQEDQARIVRLFIALNQHVEHHLSSEFQIGHSYFMREDIGTPAGLERVWKRAILPLLEEYLHGARDRDAVLAELTPEQLLAVAAPETEPEAIMAEER